MGTSVERTTVGLEDVQFSVQRSKWRPLCPLCPKLGSKPVNYVHCNHNFHVICTQMVTNKNLIDDLKKSLTEIITFWREVFFALFFIILRFSQIHPVISVRSNPSCQRIPRISDISPRWWNSYYCTQSTKTSCLECTAGNGCSAQIWSCSKAGVNRKESDYPTRDGRLHF